jgi:hypothetical protein
MFIVPEFALSEEFYPMKEYIGFSNIMKSRIDKMRLLMGKSGKCQVAILGGPIRFLQDIQNEYYLPEVVTCIANIVVGEGTLGEQAGCALVSYSFKTASYGNFYNQYFPRAMDAMFCEQGGFEKLIAKKGLWSPYSGKEVSVENAIFSPAQSGVAWKFILIFAKDKKLVDWFNEANRKFEIQILAGVKEENEKMKKRVEAEKKIEKEKEIREREIKAQERKDAEKEMQNHKKFEDLYD